LNLTTEPEIVNWPESHFVFVEKEGAFSSTAPKAWQELHRFKAAIAQQSQIIGAVALYRAGPKIYRAGFLLAGAARELPDNLQYTLFAGGKYGRFVLTGSYSHLHEASARVWSIVSERSIPLRDDFAIEYYANDPSTTPEEQLITEILIPIK
jgi:AraC family transcriptional regulator